MHKRNEKLFALSAGVLVLIGLFYLQSSDSVLNTIMQPVLPIDWKAVHERDIVKVSIPVLLLEQKGNNCTVSAENFASIVDHTLFVNGKTLEKELNFNRESNTLVLACDKLSGEKSRLNVWHVVEESAKFPARYEYFVTPWEETGSTQNAKQNSFSEIADFDIKNNDSSALFLSITTKDKIPKDSSFIGSVYSEGFGYGWLGISEDNLVGHLINTHKQNGKFADWHAEIVLFTPLDESIFCIDDMSEYLSEITINNDTITMITSPDVMAKEIKFNQAVSYELFSDVSCHTNWGLKILDTKAI